jgi:hypothetical protein
MCTKIDKDAKQYIAEEDIICYKGLIQRRGTRYYTMFRLIPIRIGVTYKGKLIVIHEYNKSYIHIGFHSFCNSDVFEKDIIYYLNPNTTTRATVIPCECIIPKGSIYYVGTFGNYPCFVSDAIKYVKVLQKDNIN